MAALFLLPVPVPMPAAFAQSDQILSSHPIENYVPPPMFQDADIASPPPINKSNRANRGALIVTGDKDILPPQKEPSTQKAKNLQPVQHIKPPLPPRRPQKFKVSPDLLDGIRNGTLAQTHKAPADTANLAYTGSKAEDDTLEIVPMNINDVYRNLSDNGL